MCVPRAPMQGSQQRNQAGSRGILRPPHGLRTHAMPAMPSQQGPPSIHTCRITISHSIRGAAVACKLRDGISEQDLQRMKSILSHTATQPNLQCLRTMDEPWRGAPTSKECGKHTEVPLWAVDPHIRYAPTSRTFLRATLPYQMNMIDRLEPAAHIHSRFQISWKLDWAATLRTAP